MLIEINWKKFQVSNVITEKDRKILEIIKSRKATTKEISALTGIPITTVHNRIKKMEENGIIKAYKAIVDNKKIGYNIEAFIEMELLKEDVAERISKIKNVEECCLISGQSDCLIKVLFKNIDELNEFIEKLKKMNVKKTVTHIILKKIK